jgi:hypothetical protein
MRFAIVVLFAAALPLIGCGTEPCSVGGEPAAGVNTGTKTIFWSPVASATSYNVYIKTVENCDQLDSTQQVSLNDQKFSNVQSPFDVSQFSRCHTCYYYSVTSVTGSCESTVRAAGGFGSVRCP